MCFLLILSLCIHGAGCFGQAGRTELFGTITDPFNLPVPNAKVTAEEEATSARFAATTDERGVYHLLGLPAGNYKLSVELPGFRMQRQSGIDLRIADHTELDVQIQVGEQTQSIDVTGEAPLLQTATGEVSHNVDQTKISSLPLDGRNFISLVTLSPGVALPGGGSVLPRINGSRPRTNEYLYDGISVLQPEPGQVVFFPILDGIEEFRLDVNAYSAEYGRSNGGTIMVSGKSGGNQLHGTIFEYFRNEALNAKNYFAPPGPTAQFRRNQYGFAVGGPIQKDKTFFFTDWQGTRLRTAVTRISTVPTLAQRQGVFATPVTDPLTGQTFTTIPSNRIDPVAQQVLQHYPAPTSAGAANNFSRTAVDPDNQDQFDARIDHNFGSNHRIFGRYSYFRDEDTPVTPLPDGSGSITSGVTGHAVTRGDGIAAAHEWALTPTMLNHARFGYTKRDLHPTSLQNGGIPVLVLPQNSCSSI